MIYENILGTIGRTPIVRVRHLAPPDTTLYVKCEFFNPGGSVKDRLAIAIIEDAEARGESQGVLAAQVTSRLSDAVSSERKRSAIAATGAMRTARRAGPTEDMTVTPMPTANPTNAVRASKTSGPDGSV